MIGSLVCAIGLIGSGAMIMFSVLPFWGSLRKSSVYRRALPGFNAAAVGLVVCAVFAMYDKFTCALSLYVPLSQALDGL